MKDEHPWKGMLKKYILCAAASVSLCGFVYVVWGQYQAAEPFYPDRYGDSSTLQGNAIIFPEQEQTGMGPGEGDSGLWEKEEHAKEERRPESNPDLVQMIRVPHQETEPALGQVPVEAEIPEPALPEQEQVSAERYAAAGPGTNGPVVSEIPQSGQTVHGEAYTRIPADGTESGGDETDDLNDDTSGAAETKPTKPAEPTEPAEPVKPTEPDRPEQPADPENSGRSGLPVNPEDEKQGIVPFPREGIPDDGAGHVYRLSFQKLDDDAREQLYYSQQLDDWDLLCAVYAYVEVDGVRKYRLDGYGDCFQIESYPETAIEAFDATFAFRQNPEETWQETAWNYSVQPYKLILEDWDGEELDCLFPEEGEAVNLLKYNRDLLPYEAGDKQSAIFPGWMQEQGTDGTAGNFYTAEEKGMEVLKPLPMEEVPEGMTVELQTAEVEDELCWIQALTECDSYENGAEGTLDVPDGIQRVAAEEEAGIRAMTMYVPEDVMEIASGSGIAVDGAYQVDSRNAVYSSQDGVLFDQEQTVLYQAPLMMESLVVPETVTEISDYGIANVSEIRFLSEEPPKFRTDTLKEGVTIYVPTDQYFSYLSAWGEDQYTLLTEEGEKPDYLRINGLLLSEDGTILFGLEDTVEGICVIPDGVRTIKAGALKYCGSVHTIRFRSEKPPELESGIFGTGQLPEILVPAGAADAFRKAWEPVLGEACAELVIREIDGNTCLGADGVEYHMKGNSGKAVLWKAPEDLEQYTPESVPEGLTVTEIADEAFAGCSELDTVILPDTVERIGTRVFAGSGLRELHLFDSLGFLERDFLEGTALEILNLEGTDLVELDYGKRGRAFSFGCEEFRIRLNGEDPEEGDLLAEEYLACWSLQILGYETRDELYRDIYREEFWNGGFLDWDQWYQTVQKRTEEMLLDGENKVRRMMGLEELDPEEWTEPQELADEDADEDTDEAPEADWKQLMTGTPSDAEREIIQSEEQEDEADDNGTVRAYHSGSQQGIYRKK